MQMNVAQDNDIAYTSLPQRTLSSLWSSIGAIVLAIAPSVAIVVASTALASCAVSRDPVSAPMSSSDWDLEFSELLAGLSRNYANFEDSIRVRKVDLATAAMRTRVAISVGKGDQDRRAAIDRFMRALSDPHLFVRWADGHAAVSDSVCHVQFFSNATRPGVRFDQLPTFIPVDSVNGRTFLAGLLSLGPSLRVGVVRIPIFMPRAFKSECEGAAREAGVQPEAPCDSECIERTEGQAGRNLNRALVATIRELERSGATHLLIDVTGNDGGTDWSEVVARILTGPVRSARIGMLRHAEWRRFLDERAALLRSALEKAPEGSLARYERAIRDLDALRLEFDGKCDLSGAWSTNDPGALPRCATLLEGGVYATGVFAGEADAPVGVSAALYSPALYSPFPLKATRLPLVVLVDARTHSAAEQFSALLQDSGAALIVGGVSAGAGCGTFTDAGTGFFLSRTGAQIHVPDCVRFRADGRSERRGVTPDRIVPWGPSDSQYEIASKAAVALDSLR